MLEVIRSIGSKKFVSVVTDNGSNVALARELITREFPNIFNIRCIAHCLNLISQDILKHEFASKIIKYCNVLVTYFKKSHLCGSLLENLINTKGIYGGGLKTYVKTRWITVAECTASILRLKTCLIEVN